MSLLAPSVSSHRHPAALGDLHRFDLAAGEWGVPSAAGQPPSPRGYFGAVAAGGSIFVFGGKPKLMLDFEQFFDRGGAADRALSGDRQRARMQCGRLFSHHVLVVRAVVQWWRPRIAPFERAGCGPHVCRAGR
jgi:hypothetical protein